MATALHCGRERAFFELPSPAQHIVIEQGRQVASTLPLACVYIPIPSQMEPWWRGVPGARNWAKRMVGGPFAVNMN
jgi:hypothetical protein